MKRIYLFFITLLTLSFLTTNPSLASNKETTNHLSPSQPANLLTNHLKIDDAGLNLNLWFLENTNNLPSENLSNENLNSKDYKNQSKKPVLVFFYDSNLTNVDAPGDIYDGRYFISQNSDIVFVTADINLNVSGLTKLQTQITSTPSFAKKNDDNEIEGAIKSLKWINENIENYGGDKNNITLCGENFGATLVSVLPIVKEAKGLFQKAIISSPILNSSLFEETKTIDALQKLNDEYKQGTAADIKLIVSVSSYDVSRLLHLYQRLLAKEADDETFINTVEKSIQDIYNEEKNLLPEEIAYNIEEFIATTKEETNFTTEEILMDIYDKIFFKLPAVKFATEQSKWNDVYFLNFENETTPVSSNFSYIMNSNYLLKREKEVATKSNIKVLDKTNLLLYKNLSTYYTNFVKTGNPNKNYDEEEVNTATASALVKTEEKKDTWEKFTHNGGEMLTVSEKIYISNTPFSENSVKNTETLLKYNISRPLTPNSLGRYFKDQGN